LKSIQNPYAKAQQKSFLQTSLTKLVNYSYCLPAKYQLHLHFSSKKQFFYFHGSKLHLSMEILFNAISPIAIIEVFCLNFHTIIDVLIASSDERTLEMW
jgi:hypothetical protein